MCDDKVANIESNIFSVIMKHYSLTEMHFNTVLPIFSGVLTNTLILVFVRAFHQQAFRPKAEYRFTFYLIENVIRIQSNNKN